MVLLAMLYTRTFYGCKRLFDRLPMPRHFRPAIGALLTGLVAVCLYGLASCFMSSLAHKALPAGRSRCWRCWRSAIRRFRMRSCRTRTSAPRFC